MKKVLLLVVACLMISSVAMADHLGIYSDATGASCFLGAAPGFYTTPTIMHKFSANGTTGVRFKVTVPVGSSIFAFNTTMAPNGQLGSDMSVGYGACLNGSFAVGTIVAQLAAGELKIETADLQPYLMMTDCTFTELPLTGGSAWVGTPGECHEVATEQSTWGKVKSLYR
jgi:hypothetical protein